LARTGPLFLGALAGLAAAVIAPCSATDSFFSTSAQVLPVALLAVVVELRVFGSPIRHFTDEQLITLGAWLRSVEVIRVPLAVLIALAMLVGQWYALRALHGAAGNPKFTYSALASGFIAVGAIAVLGMPRARATAALKAIAYPNNPAALIIEAGMANEFGDRDVEVVMNLLFPEDASIFKSRQNGGYIEHPQTLTTDERLRPFPPRWTYVFQRVRISAGAAQVTYYVLSGVPPGRHRLLLRVGNQELTRGGPEVDLWISSGPDGIEVIDHS
jgi:hypothetical protein